jgi:hypothetical protein
MKITKKELQQFIKEEAIKFKRKVQLEKELSEVKKQLDEVHAAGMMDSEKNDGVHAGQHEPKFTKKGTALVEDEMEEGFENSEEKEENEVSDFNLEEMLAEMLGEMNSEECEDEESLDEGLFSKDYELDGSNFEIAKNQPQKIYNLSDFTRQILMHLGKSNDVNKYIELSSFLSDV